MIKHLIILFLALFISSCGVFKKVQKQEHKEQTSTDTEAITSSTITEQIDTNVRILSAEVSTISLIDVLINEGIIEAENDEVKVKATYDPTTRKIKLTGTRKEVVVPVKGKRTKIVSKKEKTHSETKTEDYWYSKLVFRWSWWWLLLLLIPLAILAWLNRKRVLSLFTGAK